MFDFIRKHTRVLFFFLIVLIIPSFVFFGLQGYTNMDSERAQVVATVGDSEITMAELDAAHRQQIERIRVQQPNVDVRMLDTPEMRLQSLDTLIRERLLETAADKMHLVTTDARMVRIFQNDSQFEFLRRPDGSVNSDILAAQGMSTELFEQRLRRDISVNQVLQGVSATVLPPAAAASAALDAFLQRREVQVQRFEPSAYADKVKPTDDELQAFYKDNAAQFQAPEQIDLEYLVLDAEKLGQDVKVDEEELRKYYKQNEARYSTPQERRASHILVKVDPSASADERAAAKAKAEALLAEVRKEPQRFAEVAQKNSDDPGSAANGGDLDFFSKGAMVKPFEDTVFALKPDEISDLVTTDFGYHIIKLTGVRGGDKHSYETVRPELEKLLRQQLAQQKYQEAAVEFSNLVYEQADSLAPAAEKLKLEVKTAKGLTRAAGDATGPLASPKFLEAVFSSDSLRNKRNTEAVEVSPTQMISARVVKHAPAHTRPFEEVREQVLAAVTAKQAAELARKAGEARLAELKASPQAEMKAAPVVVSRAQSSGLSPKAIDAALGAPTQTLPTLVGVDVGGQGYVVLKVNKVLGREPGVEGDAEAMRSQYAQALAEAETRAYYESLKRRFNVERKPLPSATPAN
ncbi:peptidylprolyl isomerase [Piscinibacter sakaiensis]|uniref:peptidylprolyl isomerase n=1 Tax=Piscinibacter sakaiensis TaxID=1547922 RepID=UPI003AB0028C